MAQIIFEVLPGECNGLSGEALQEMEGFKVPGEALSASS